MMGLEGGFLWVWIMGDKISEHSSACHKKFCKILWVPIMPETLIWVCDFFLNIP
jgi:hypothetical protein